jgi:glucans biosynthesis protein C
MTDVKATNSSAGQLRLAHLDNIRIFLTALVIMHHAAITYGADGGWYYHEIANNTLGGFEKLFYMLLATIDQSYFMGFFFLIAGYFTPMSLVRKGTATYMKDRLLRLGIPLAGFALLLAPLTIGASRVTQEGGTFFDGFYWIFAMHNYECGPLWFVQALLIFSFIYLIYATLVKGGGKVEHATALPSHAVLLAAAIFTGLLAFSLRLEVPVGQNVCGMQIGYFATYIVLFFVGCRAAKGKWLEKVSFKYALPWMLVSIASIIACPFLSNLLGGHGSFAGGCSWMAFFYAAWEPFAAWGIILGLLWGFRKYLNRAGPFAANLARCSFAVYIIHAPVLVAVSILMKDWAAAPLCKWTVVGLLSCVVAWTIAAGLVKLPGLRKVL